MHQEFSIKNFFIAVCGFFKDCYLKDRQRLVLGWPVIFGCGILAYFSLSQQPKALTVGALFVSSLLFVVVARHRWLNVAVFAFCLGFGVSHLRTVILNTFMIDQRIQHFSFTGIVADIEDTQRGVRLLLHLKEQLAGYEAIQKIRLSLRASLPVPDIGTEIKGEATLLPLGGVLSESGYNFRRVAYFQGISATGQLLSYQKIAVGDGHFETVLKGLRRRITDAITKQFMSDQDVGGIMAALITGTRGGISNTTRQAFTDAGLAHLLAISGLHLSLIAGFVFLMMRRGLSLSMYFAESFDLKKTAACLTIPFLLFYLVISGVGIPALRAFLMICLAMMAVVIDRTPLSMRLVCFAASLILLIYPESLLSASFQLSFAAVVALIGVYENGWRPFHLWAERGGIFKKMTLYLVGIIATTLIASYATTPLTIAIFQRFSLQAVLGNLVAIPLTGFIIMPLIVIFLLLMLVGGEFLIAPFLKGAIQLLIKVSLSIATLPGAAIIMPEQSPGFLTLFIIGGIWFCLWQQRWRYLGFIPMMLAFCCLKFVADPKILIPEREQAIYGFDGKRAFCLGCKASGFMQEMFLRQVGMREMEKIPSATLTQTINNSTIFLTVKKLSKSKLRHQCQEADYLLSPRSIFYACPDKSKIVDRFTLQRQGTVIASFKTAGIMDVKTSCQWQGCRLWSEAKCCQITSVKD
jgi:competence protein ComEC